MGEWRDAVGIALSKENRQTGMYLESHMEFATASACQKAADEILRSSALKFLKVKRMNGDRVDFYLARRLFCVACCYSK